MRKWWWIATLICSVLSAEMTKQEAEQEIQKIDKQVQKLNVQKQKHIELSRKYQKEGNEWDYKTGRIQEAHESWTKADDERRKALDYQRQIDLLLEKKQSVYLLYPELQHE